MTLNLTPFEALKLAVKNAGSQAKLAGICGVSQTAVWKWLQSSKKLPAEYVLRVEAETGVSRHQLRPDIYPNEMNRAEASCAAETAPVCGSILSARLLSQNGKRNAVLDVAGSAA